MKKNNSHILTILLFSVFASCTSEKPQEAADGFLLKNAENRIKWVAYKATEKIPVEGTFTNINITSKGEGNTIKEALNNAEFSIPVSSLLSGEQDYNIINFFFGAMVDTELLFGKIVLTNDTNGYAEITMNGIKEKMNFTYTLKDKKITLIAKMDLTKWNTEDAVSSLHEKCGLLHRGADGIVKLWEDVSIEITSTF